MYSRMLVIVAPKDYGRSMAPADPAYLPVRELRPYLAAEMKTWKDGRAVGIVPNNNPGLIVPV